MIDDLYGFSTKETFLRAFDRGLDGMRSDSAALPKGSTIGSIDLGTTTLSCAYITIFEDGNKTAVKFLTDYPSAHGTENPYTETVTSTNSAYKIEADGKKVHKWGAAVRPAVRSSIRNLRSSSRQWHIFGNLKAPFIDSERTEDARKKFQQTLNDLNRDYLPFGELNEDEPLEDLLRQLSNHWQAAIRSEGLPELSSLTICVPATLKVAEQSRLSRIFDRAFGFKPSDEFPMEAEAVMHAILAQRGHSFQIGDVVMILDLGGLTSDCSIFKILSLDPIELWEAAPSSGIADGALRMNDAFDQWYDEKIKECSVADQNDILVAKHTAHEEFELYIKFQKPPDDFELPLGNGICLTKDTLLKICFDAQNDTINWAVKQVEQNKQVTQIAIVGGLGKSWYFQEQFTQRIQNVTIHNVPTAHILTLVAHGGLVMAMRLHKVVSRYLRSNICYELSEPYQPRPGEDWDILERKGKSIPYVKAAAIAFPLGARLCDQSSQNAPRYMWLYREARKLEDLKNDLKKLVKTLYTYDGTLEPLKSVGEDIRYWNAKDCAFWKRLVLEFDVSQLRGLKRTNNIFRFYYRLEATISGLSITFQARARPDGKWSEEENDILSMTALCSTEIDPVHRQEAQVPVSVKRKRSNEGENSPIPAKKLRQEPESGYICSAELEMNNWMEAAASPTMFQDLFNEIESRENYV